MTKVDLERLKNEVLSQPADAALPCNLSDYWLATISKSLELFFENTEGDGLITAPMALIIHILAGKNGNKEIQISYKEIFTLLENYQLEIGLEEVNRKTNVKTSPATLETIFTDRLIVSIHD